MADFFFLWVGTMKDIALNVSFHIQEKSLIFFNLSQTTNFSLFQIETVCRRQFQICWKWQKAPKQVENTVGKRRNCSLRAISPFPAVFSKGMFCRHVKTRACLGKGYDKTHVMHFCWTWDKFSNWLLNKDLCRNNIFAHSVDVYH